MEQYRVKTKVKESRLIAQVKLSFKQIFDMKQLEYFSKKHIRGLLKVEYKKSRFLEYSGPVGISLYERLKKPIKKYEFLFIMEQIVDMERKLKLNTLISKNLVLDLKTVFINETTKELQFIYLPIEKRLDKDAMKFMEDIIYTCKLAKEGDTEYVSRFIYFLSSLHQFDIDKIENYIMKEDRNVVNTIQAYSAGQSGYIRQNMSKDCTEDNTELLAGENTELLEIEDGTGLLEYQGTEVLETGVIDVCEMDKKLVTSVYLHRTLTDEIIWLDKPVYRIGKEKSYSDYFVANNDKVSRSHADIITRNGKHFIMDLNSKNHTYINGYKLTPNEEFEINMGDKLVLANEEFFFKVK